MATSVATNTTTSVRVRDLPAPPIPVRRITAAVVLFAGATLQLVEELIEPPFATDTDRFAWMAQHTTLHAVDVGIGLAAIPLLITAVLLLARLAGRMPRLARTGAAFCVVGFCGLAAVHGFEYAELAMLDAGVSPATVETAVGTVQPAIAIPFLASFLVALSIGLPLLLIALWRSRGVPRGAIVTSFAFMVLDFAGPELPFPSHGLSFIAFTWMAIAIVRPLWTNSGQS
jgi:hypothetical protein